MRIVCHLIMALMISIGQMASAQSFDSQVYAANVQDWRIDALTDSQGFLGCAGLSDQPFGVLAVIQSRDGWLLRVPTMQTESFGGALVTIDNRVIDAQIGYLPEGAGEIMLADEAVGWLASAGQVTVKPNGDFDATWGLRGSAAMIAKVQECVSAQGSAAAAKPVPAAQKAAPEVNQNNVQLGSDGCPDHGAAFSSQANAVEATIQFVNRSDIGVVIYWIGFDGWPVEYASLSPGQSYDVNTWVDHFWIARDANGMCRGGIMAPRAGGNLWEIH